MATTSSHPKEEVKKKKKKEGLGWIEWARGWLYLVYEMLFQRITASHLQNPMPLPPVNDLTCIVTGSTSGIGREIARSESPSFKSTKIDEFISFSFSVSLFVLVIT